MIDIYKDLLIRLIVFIGLGWVGTVLVMKGIEKIVDCFGKEERTNNFELDKK